jgi:hypothetical protein
MGGSVPDLPTKRSVMQRQLELRAGLRCDDPDSETHVSGIRDASCSAKFENGTFCNETRAASRHRCDDGDTETQAQGVPVACHTVHLDQSGAFPVNFDLPECKLQGHRTPRETGTREACSCIKRGQPGEPWLCKSMAILLDADRDFWLSCIPVDVTRRSDLCKSAQIVGRHPRVWPYSCIAGPCLADTSLCTRSGRISWE